MRFGTSDKRGFCVWCAKCAKYLAFGTSAMDALRFWKLQVLMKKLKKLACIGQQFINFFFQLIASTPDDSSLSSDQDTN